MRRYASAVTVGVLLVVCVAAGFVREFSGDFHWHVVVGRDVLHGTIGTIDRFSHTFAGQPVMVSSWLADGLLALAYTAGGYPGCFALRALCVVAIFGLSCREMTRRGLAAWAAAPLCLLALSWMLFRLYLRPEMFAFAAFAGLLHILGEHERAPRRWQVPALLVVVALWSNLHGSVGIGLAAIGLFALEQLWRRRRLIYLLLPVAAFAAACLNPEGIRLPLAFRILSPTWVAHVPEWLPLRWTAIPPELLALGLAAAASTLALLRRASPWLVALVALFTWLTFRYARFVSFAQLAMLPLLGANLAALSKRVAAVVAAAALAWGLAGLALERRLQDEVGLGLDEAWYPVDACRFARHSHFSGKMLNSYDFGSYLMFCLPESPVWIDQRAWSLYPDAFYKRYLDSVRSPAALRALAGETQVSWALVNYDPLAAQMGNDPDGWHLVYFDDRAEIFVRDGAASPVPPFRYLAPDRVATLPDLTGEALTAARAELAVQDTRCPGCTRTLLVRAALAVAAGDDGDFRRTIGRLLDAGETQEVAFLAGKHALRRGEWAYADEMFQRFQMLGGDPAVAAMLRDQVRQRSTKP